MALMPRPTVPIAGPGGLPTREWLDYLRELAGAGDLSGINRAIAELQQQVAALEKSGASGEVLGIGAIQNIGSLADGLVRLDLRQIDDAGGGELVKIVRDAYGRVAGTSSATTDDLAEGLANHYFHEAPEDGREYARKDGGWVETTGGGVPEAPEDGKVYGRKDGNWEEVEGGDGPPGPPGPPGPSSSCFPTASFSGGGGDIQAGASQTLYIPFGFEITGAALIADQAGTIQIDIRKTDLASYPPTSLDSICGGAPPTLSANDKTVITDFTLWETEVESGDALQFICTACVGIKSAALVLTGTRS